MEKEIIITSRRGMTPFARATSMSEARRLSRDARRLGLDGEIVTPADLAEEARDRAFQLRMQD